jgi:hypothetical protein
VTSPEFTSRQQTPSAVGPGWLHWFEKHTWALGLLLICATVALYYPAHYHQFVDYDDAAYVTENLHVQSVFDRDTVKWAFTTLEGGNWHPVTWLSHALDYELFELNPAGHHDVNVLLHALNVLLLFWVLQQATGFAGRSFVVAGLFALHPVNVDSVAWIAERKNLLSMLFFLLALAAYRWYAREPRIYRYATVALLFALGLMAKPQVITLPFVLLLWDYWPLQRMIATDHGAPLPGAQITPIPSKSLSWLAVEKLPLLALSAGSALVTMRAQETGMFWYPPIIRAENAIVSYALYIRNIFWPFRLAVMYPHPMAPLRVRQVAIALMFLLTISALVAKNWRRRYLTVGWLWFLGTLVPMIGIVQVGYQAMADRYAYLPFIGLFIMICWGVADWAEQKHLVKAALPALSIAVLLGSAVIAHRQLSYWSDSVTLWSHALEVNPGNWFAEDHLGTLLMKQGNVDAGMQHFLRAATINRSDPLSNLNVGFYDYQHRDLRGAAEHYQAVINARSSGVLKVKALNNLGLVYRESGDPVRAQQCFRDARELSRKYSR